MPQMQWLKAEQRGAHYHFHIWLDTTKTDAQDKPDSAYVREYRWPATPPPGWTGATLNGVAYTDWLAYVQAETMLLAAADLAVLEPAITTLAAQGQTFTPPGS
jgi:hypothetical protein